VGQTDLAPADVRRLIGGTAIVGRSTHSAAQADAASREPISYLAIGPVFATASKGATVDPVVGLDGVRAAAEIAARASLPVVAIGGITLERAPGVLRAGAASVAVIADLLQGDPAARVRAFGQTLESLTL
jgi:thiamine-phosphate pyrophosphorylase